MSSCEYGTLGYMLLQLAILARANINDLCHGVSIPASRPIALLSLADTEMTSWQQYGELFCFYSVVFFVFFNRGTGRVHGHYSLPLCCHWGGGAHNGE